MTTKKFPGALRRGTLAIVALSGDAVVVQRRKGTEHEADGSDTASPRWRSSLGSDAMRSRSEALAAEALPKLGADLAATSVSGLSSGAFMAVQIEVAHSKDIVGAGIVAGGPYACAESAASRLVPVLAVGGGCRTPRKRCISA